MRVSLIAPEEATEHASVEEALDKLRELLAADGNCFVVVDKED